MATDSQKAADSARNQRDKVAGITKINLRIREEHKPVFQDLAKKSREGELVKGVNQ